MQMIFVKPAPGGRIRMPERNYRPMPEAGDFVPRNDFYERLLASADIVECEPQPVATIPQPDPTSEPAGSANGKSFSKEK